MNKLNILNRHACMYEFKGIFTNKQQINRINYDKIETRLYIIGFDLPSRKNNSIDAASFCFFTRDLCWHHIVHQPHAPHDWTLSGPISIALRLQSHGMEDAAKWDEERLSEANINIYQHSIHSSTSFSIKLLDHRPNQPPTFAALQALLLMAYSRAALVVKQLFPAQIMRSPIAPRQLLAHLKGKEIELVVLSALASRNPHRNRDPGNHHESSAFSRRHLQLICAP